MFQTLSFHVSCKVPCIAIADPLVRGTCEIVTRACKGDDKQAWQSSKNGSTGARTAWQIHLNNSVSMTSQTLMSRGFADYCQSLCLFLFLSSIRWPELDLILPERMWVPLIATFRLQRDILKGRYPQTAFLSPCVALFYKLKFGESWLGKLCWRWGFSTRGRASQIVYY